VGSSNGDGSLVSPEGSKAALGRGCLMEGIPGPFSIVGEGGEDESVERDANQGYPLTVSFQTFGSVALCMMVYTVRATRYASNINVMTQAKLSRTFPERHTLAAILPRRGRQWLLGTIAERAAAAASSMSQKIVTQINSTQMRLV